MYKPRGKKQHRRQQRKTRKRKSRSDAEGESGRGCVRLTGKRISGGACACAREGARVSFPLFVTRREKDSPLSSELVLFPSEFSGFFSCDASSAMKQNETKTKEKRESASNAFLVVSASRCLHLTLCLSAVRQSPPMHFERARRRRRRNSNKESKEAFQLKRVKEMHEEWRRRRKASCPVESWGVRTPY